MGLCGSVLSYVGLCGSAWVVWGWVGRGGEEGYIRALPPQDGISAQRFRVRQHRRGEGRLHGPTLADAIERLPHLARIE